MASFDPTVPSVPIPDWTRVSRPIQQPESDKSTGIALGTAATGIEEAAKLYDTSEKSFLREKVDTGVNKLRDDYINAYQGIKNAQNVIPDQEQTLAEAQQSQVPGGLQAGLDRAKAIGASQIQGGHLNDTLYTMNLNSLAKQMRAQYPGYRDYIDEQIKTVSGVDPANAVMRNLLEDINRNAGNAKSEHDKITTMVRDAVKQGIPNANVAAALWDAGKLSPSQVYSYIYKYSSREYERQQEMSDRTNEQGRLSDIQTKTEQSFAKIVASDTMAALDITHIAGGTQTAQGLVDTITKANSEGAKVDPVKLEQGLMGLTALRANVVANAIRKANEPDANGQTTMGLIGEQKVMSHITAQVKPLDEYIKYIGDEKLGFAHTASRVTQSIDEKNNLNLYNDPKVGTQLQALGALYKIAPNWGDAMLKQGLLNNLDKDLIPIMQGKLANAASQIDPLHPASLKEDIQQAKKANVDPKTRLIDNYLMVPKILADPKAPDDVKLNVAKYAFAPNNWGVMDEIKMDYTNQKGQYVPGKYSAFDRMLSTDIIDSMYKLKQQGGDGRIAWDNMKKWGENEFPILFREDLNNMTSTFQAYKQFQERSAANATLKPTAAEAAVAGRGGNFDIHWDNDRNQFLELPNPSRNPHIDNMNKYIRRVDGALAQLSNIQDKDGGNTSRYILEVLNNADPATQSITEPMKTAIISSHDKTRSLKTLEDTFEDRFNSSYPNRKQ